MKSQEVMELMNRYLDGNLDERELERLESHLRQSPEAAAMFERLKRLHHQLEQLPMVTPPTSIVDAILPRLEQIDAGEGSLGRERAGSRERQRSERRGRPNRKWAVGTVAAAVLALAVALPAGIGLLDRRSSDLADAPAGALREESAGLMMKTETEAASPAQGATAFGRQEGGNGPGASTPKDATSTADAPKERADATVTDRSEAKDQYGIASISEGETDGNETGGEVADQVGTLGGELSFQGSNDGLAGILGFSGNDADDGRTPVTAFAEGAPPSGWQVSVVPTEDGERVVITDEKGVDVFISASYPGKAANFRWTEDGGKLSFDYEADGKTHRVTIDLTEGTENAVPLSPQSGLADE